MNSSQDAVRPKVETNAQSQDEAVGEAEESTAAMVPKAGVKPTQEEVERHNVIHLPFRSWCAYRVAGKAKAEPHRTKDPDRPVGVNLVSIDYAF